MTPRQTSDGLQLLVIAAICGMVALKYRHVMALTRMTRTPRPRPCLWCGRRKIVDRQAHTHYCPDPMCKGSRLGVVPASNPGMQLTKPSKPTSEHD